MKYPLILAAFVFAQPLFAADGIRRETVQFEKGKSGTTVKGTLTGDEVVDYVLGAKGGQTMSVELTTSRGTNYFNVLPPGSGKALFVGSMNEGKRFEGQLPADGEYTVRLYQMGNAKDAGLKAEYSLELSITDGESKDFDRKLSLQGIDFHVATKRGEGGKTMLVVTPAGLELDNRPQEVPITGTVVNAEVGDINADGSPELYVYLRQPGEEARGKLLAWSANRKKSISDIYLSELAEDDPKMEGYRGHDEFAVVEGILARRFPISEADAEEKKIRQFQYKLVPGEAGWILKLDRTVEF